MSAHEELAQVTRCLVDQEDGTMLIAGMWIYVKEDADNWVEADVRHYVTTKDLARFLVRTTTVNPRTPTWTLY